MLQTEVTQRQYKRLMGTNPSIFTSYGGNCPVEKVSWHDALRFANALSRKEGWEPCFVCSGGKCRVKRKYRGKGYYDCKGYRLPTEAEWEYAARAGTRSSRYGKLDAIAWYSGNSEKKTHRVASKLANRWGLYDMLGNVWEWVFDGSGKYRRSYEANPVRTVGTFRVVRGGSWINNARSCRAAFRDDYLVADNRFSNLGFRLSRSLPEIENTLKHKEKNKI